MSGWPDYYGSGRFGRQLYRLPAPIAPPGLGPRGQSSVYGSVYGGGSGDAFHTRGDFFSGNPGLMRRYHSAGSGVTALRGEAALSGQRRGGGWGEPFRQTPPYSAIYGGGYGDTFHSRDNFMFDVRRRIPPYDRW